MTVKDLMDQLSVLPEDSAVVMLVDDAHYAEEVFQVGVGKVEDINKDASPLVSGPLVMPDNPEAVDVVLITV